jgi:60 kDa SS-A/Ro ribonucleoprotein
MNKNLSARNPSTIQVNEPLKPGMVQNHDGAYVFKIGPEQRLKRFLILGSPTTYYQNSKSLTEENLAELSDLWKKDPKGTAAIIREISVAGRAPNNDYALAALAIGVGIGGDSRVQAFSVLNDVARIGTHILHFAKFLKNRSGWGRSVRTGISKWYMTKSPDKLAYQVLKYQSRDGWSHKDLIKMCHVLSNRTHKAYKPILEYVSHDKISPELLEGVKIIGAFEKAKSTSDAAVIVDLIKNHDLSREMIPTQFLNDKAVWKALLDGMIKNNLMEALIRNLNKLTSLGILTKKYEDLVIKVLTDPNNLKAARLHPLKILVALKTYQLGHGLKGSMVWDPNKRIVKALDDAFYAAFSYVEPTNKRIHISIDVSGSMDSLIDGTAISSRDAATCLAMVIARTEKNHEIAAVSDTLTPFPINPNVRMEDVIALQRNIPFGWTNLSLPLTWATNEEREFDAFVIITDNDVNHGTHPAQILKDYRKSAHGVKDAAFVVVALTSTGFSIADPSDPNSLDAVGFDAALPEIISGFIKHEF